MADLFQKVKLALDEARLLVLGAQILLGFQFRSVLLPGFDSLPAIHQHLKVATLLGVLLTIGLLMWPATYHQITERGEVTVRLHRFTSLALGWGLLPLALALGEEFAAVTHHMLGSRSAIVVGSATCAASLWFWYGLEFYCRLKKNPYKEAAVDERDRAEEGPTPLHDKIVDVLTECRVVIPGAQALLGFQLIAMLSEGFDKLPRSSQNMHLAGLLLIALSTILLMTPAAFHRIVERGEDTVRFLHHARRMLLWGMATLAAGIAAEFHVVVLRCTHSQAMATALCSIVLAGFFGAWFGYTRYRRSTLP